MVLRNAFGDLALDATVQDTNTAVAAVEAAVVDANDSVDLLSEQVVLLRKLLKLMESQAVVDNQLRQRVTVDNIAGSLTLGTVTSVGTVTTVTTVGTATTVNQFAGVDLRFQWMENARVAYNTGIRSKLTY